MAKTLIEIKQGLEGQVGRRLRLKANGGRRKTIERYGVLAETYPSVLLLNWTRMKMHSNVFLTAMRTY